jgi:hypothetical protein
VNWTHVAQDRGTEVGSCERGNEPSGSKKGRQFINYASYETSPNFLEPAASKLSPTRATHRARCISLSPKRKPTNVQATRFCPLISFRLGHSPQLQLPINVVTIKPSHEYWA